MPRTMARRRRRSATSPDAAVAGQEGGSSFRPARALSWRQRARVVPRPNPNPRPPAATTSAEPAMEAMLFLQARGVLRLQTQLLALLPRQRSGSTSLQVIVSSQAMRMSRDGRYPCGPWLEFARHVAMRTQRARHMGRIGRETESMESLSRIGSAGIAMSRCRNLSPHSLLPDCRATEEPGHRRLRASPHRYRGRPQASETRPGRLG